MLTATLDILLKTYHHYEPDSAVDQHSPKNSSRYVLRGILNFLGQMDRRIRSNERGNIA